MGINVDKEKIAYLRENIRIYRYEIALAVFLILSLINSIFFMIFLILLITYTSDNNKESYIKESTYIEVFGESIAAVKGGVAIIEKKYPQIVSEIILRKIKYYSEKKPSPTDQQYYIEYFDFCMCIYILTSELKYSYSSRDNLFDLYKTSKDFHLKEIEKWSQNPFKNKNEKHEFDWLKLKNCFALFTVLGRENEISAYNNLHKIVPKTHILHPAISKKTPLGYEYQKRLNAVEVYYGKILGDYFSEIT